MILRLILAFLLTQGPSIPMGSTGVNAAGNHHSFGRTFVAATSQAMNSSATVDLTSTSTVTLWFWLNITTTFPNNQIVAESSSNYNSNNGTLLINMAEGSCGIGTFSFGVHNTGLTANSGFPHPSVGSWHSYLLVFSMAGNASFKAYVDGTLQTLTTCNANIPSGSFGNYTFYLMSRNLSTLFANGSLSDFAIWKADESSSVSALNAGTSLPSDIDTGNLSRYAHICGTASPEPDSVSGNWALTNAPTQVAGPGVLNCP